MNPLFPEDLDESKHIATLATPIARAEHARRHHQRYPWDKYEKEEKKTRQAVLAAAGLASLIGNLNRRMMQRLFYAERLLKKRKETTVSIEKSYYARKFNEVIDSIKRDLSDGYHRSYRLGLESCGLGRRFASKAKISKEEKTWVDSAVKDEHSYFDGLVAAVIAGTAVTKLTSRASMYPTALKAMYSAGQVVAMDPGTIVEWKVTSEAEHCEDCVFLSKNGPYTADTLPTTPGAGLCRCLSSCKCVLVFRSVGDQVANKVRRGSRSKTSMLKAIQQAQKTRSNPR